MKLAKTKKKSLSVIMIFVLVVTCMAGFPAVFVYAASGTVYSCTINRCYAHPVTGEIEDSGGESSYATGQGMIEGCVYGNGILEVTDDGAYYLTIRMSLMDYTSGHEFLVQNVGDSGWSTPSETGITGNGSDSNGTTADVCMRVPSENCIVRISMYVDSMGRNVVFYVYPSNYAEGNNTDMNATMVTDTSSEIPSDSSSNVTGQQVQENNTEEQESRTDSENFSAALPQNTGNSSLQSSTTSDSEKTKETEEKTEEKKSDVDSSETTLNNNEKKMESTITETAKPETDVSSGDDSSLNSAEGLSISTVKEVENTDTQASTSSGLGSQIFKVSLAVVISGLILIGAIAGVVYFFRKNWKRWGGADDDEE